MNIIHGDCIEQMKLMDPASVHLIFADPPFNIDYAYDIYSDKREHTDYMGWSGQWLSQAVRLLKPHGTLWLAIGDSYASDLDVLCRHSLGLVRRSWVVWHFTFGVNCKRKFTPSHTHLFHYTNHPKHFTFNAPEIMVPSARQTIYNDSRASVGGRLPDDVWTLRARGSSLFPEDADTWYVPRLAGTHKERVNHVCQMPLAVLDRIIKVSSDPGDHVLDPFAGSGTTLVAATRLGREATGIELSANYCDTIHRRFGWIWNPDTRTWNLPAEIAPEAQDAPQIEDK